MTDQEIHKKLTLSICYEFIDKKIFALNKAPATDNWPGYVGMEVEMFPVHKSEHRGIPELLIHQNNPVFRALTQLAIQQEWQLFYEETETEKLLLVIKISEGETLTFEPGGQIEYSSQPFRCLDLVQTRLLEIQHLIEAALKTEGVGLIQMGLNPWHTVDQIGMQTPKKRYLAMDRYFRQHSPLSGPNMMRQTCSIQVCLDFGSNDTLLLKRYLAAQLLAPFAAAIFANSPYKEQKLTPSILSHRTSIWRDLDHKRTGFVALKSLSEDLNRQNAVEGYLDFALSCPIVFIENLSYLVPTKAITMKEWMTHGVNGVFPTLKDWELHLSLLFPEVRPRGYMELRSVDCQARYWQMVPAAFYVGLLYDSKNLDRVLDSLLPHIHKLHNLMSLALHGLENTLLQQHAKQLVLLAIEGLRRIERHYCGEASVHILSKFYHHFTEKDRCPAHDLIDRVQKAGRSFPVIDDFWFLEEQWKSL